MHFEPVLIQDLFDASDVAELRSVLDFTSATKNWIDPRNDRRVLKYEKLDEYFSKKLEPIAKKIFKDDSLKSTYSVYLDYNKPTSNLPMHKDNNACTYTIDYCVSSITPWPLVIEGEEYIIAENQGLAFMGGYDSHGRNPMPNPETNRVEVIMFHFCPDDHWFFTEGEDYLYELMDSGRLPEGDSYHLSPKKR